MPGSLSVANLVDRAARKFGDRTFALWEKPMGYRNVGVDPDKTSATFNEAHRFTNSVASVMRDRLGVQGPAGHTHHRHDAAHHDAQGAQEGTEEPHHRGRAIRGGWRIEVTPSSRGLCRHGVVDSFPVATPKTLPYCQRAVLTAVYIA